MKETFVYAKTSRAGWRRIRIDSDPPLPEPTIEDRLNEYVIRDIQRGLQLHRALYEPPMPEHERNYRDAVRHEQWRLERAQEERDRADLIEQSLAVLSYTDNMLARVVYDIHSLDDNGECEGCRNFCREDGETAERWPCETMLAVIEHIR